MSEGHHLPARWVGDSLLTVGDLSFTTAAHEGAIPIVKPPDLVRRYVEVLGVERPDVIVELGTKEGGSAAMMAAVARPSVLLTVDLAAEVTPALVALRDHPELGSCVVARAGVDQADAPSLVAAVDQVRGDRRLDLVVDDASHIVGPTRASFDVLFPRLRPGGLYIIEDWGSEAVIAARLAEVVAPGHPEHAERLALIRALFLQLNQPGFRPPEAVVRALAQAHADRSETAHEGGRSGLDGVLAAVVDAAARADLEGLRAIALADLPRPMVDLAVELALVAATRPDVVASVELTVNWITVRRGAADLAMDGFALGTLGRDDFGYTAG